MRLLGKFRASPAGRAAPQRVFNNVLTPGRIPEFCIPPRLPAPCASESPPRAAALPRRCAAEPELWSGWGAEGAGRTDWDPRSQAALSLPHLPRARTAYGFCALLESPHTRRKESLFLGGPGAAALRPRARTSSGCEGVETRAPPDRACAPSSAPAWSPGGAPPLGAVLAPPPRARRFLRAPDGLLSRALRARRSRRLARARARSVSGGDGDEDEAGSARAGTPACEPPALPTARPERLEAEGTVTLGRAGGAVRLAAEYCPGRGQLRIRLLRAEGPAQGAAEARAAGCRVGLVLQPPGQARTRRGTVVRRSREPGLEQDVCFDGLSEDQVRRVAVRVEAAGKGHPGGRGELLLGPLLRL
ncbi:C2 calcium-dependent domain-containing protein 4A-like [Tenrec ecaudatus]|uniref:C2 calcium-dependent domain-containing protein 4A-like n=1 Tax=Tenrec ecaudatus TaxID=94439 RepID=UPI003F5A29CD